MKILAPSARNALYSSVAVLSIVGLAACGNSASKSAGTSGGSSSAAGSIKVAMNVKITGHTFFTEIRDGALAAAPSQGVSLTYSGPTFSDGQAQATQLNSIIQEGYKVLLLSANSPTVEAPAAEKAQAMGIPVITFDADVIPAARGWYVNDAAYPAFGKCLIDQAVKFGGPNAEVGIVSSNPDSPNQIAWINSAMAYQKANYPGLKIDGTVYGKGDEALSFSGAESLLQAHPGIKVLLTPDSGAAPGAASAITKLGMIGKVLSVGQGDLASSRQYIKNGSEVSCMWDNAGLGKLLVYMAKAAANKTLPKNGTFTSDPAGSWVIKNGWVDYAQNPTVFNKENVGKFTDAGSPIG
jgi:ABC-type sugar transport system substrate-binding protein